MKNTKNILKRQCSQSVREIQISLRVSVKDLQYGLIFIVSFYKRNFSTLEPDLYKTFINGILRVTTWNRIKRVCTV